MILTPAAALAGAGAALGQYGGPQSVQPVYEQPPLSQAYGGQTGEIAPPPAPAPLSPAQRRVVRERMTGRSQPAPATNHTAGPARVSILGAVTKPRTFEFGEAPTLGELVERAGGLTGSSDRTLRVIRGGKPVAKVEYETATAGRLAPGDVIVADAVPHAGPRERGVAHIALVGVADRPVVLAVPEGKANLATMLPMMGLDAGFAANVLVMNTTGARVPLPDGTVLVFPPGTATNQDWDGYGDLVPEPAAPAPTVADFAPVRPKPAPPEQVAAAPVLRPARRATNRPASAPPAAVPAPAAEPVVTGRSEPLSLPPLPAAAAPTSSRSAKLPAPPAGIVDGPDETVIADLLDAPPADGMDDEFGGGLGDGDFGDLALLPAPDESPFYADDAALAANDSHLIALPEPGYAPPGMAAPGLPAPVGADPMRVASRPTPGVVRDSPRLSAPRPSVPGRTAPDFAAPPQPVPGGGRPVATPVPPLTAPAGAEPVSPAAPAPAAEAPAAAEAGVPWVTLGFVLGALVGGIAAAGVALKRRTAALVTAHRAAENDAPAPDVSEAAVRRAAERAATERSATADRKVLDDLLADRLPLREEAVRLPKHVALHGATAGKAKLRLDEAHEQLAAPHFAPAGDGLSDGVRGRATAETVSA